jgi:hypothetical protein
VKILQVTLFKLLAEAYRKKPEMLLKRVTVILFKISGRLLAVGFFKG